MRLLLFRSRLMRCLAAVLCVATLAFRASEASAQTPFYHATPQELAGPPGSLIRSEPMMFAPAGAQALPRALSFGRHAGRADRRVRRHRRSARTCACGRPADRGLGASDHRRGAALRAVACDLCVSSRWPGCAS